MDTFKQPWVTYAGVIVAVIAIVSGVFWPQYANILWGIASIAGFGSVASLRAFIESQGWKSYAVVVVNVIPSLLFAFKVLDAETFAALTAALGVLLGGTVQQALSKAKTT